MAQREAAPFCATPFLQLHLGLKGEVSPCCWGREIVVGQAQKESLMSIWNGTPLQKLRREFLTGNVVTCQKRIQERQCHLYHAGAIPNIERAEIQSKPPTMLHTRLSGLCNLQCEMCDIWQRPENPYEKSDLWTKGPTEIFPFLKRMTVVGGEPFIQDQTFRLMDQVSVSNPDCKWSIVTNGQWALSPKIKSSLDRLKHVNIVVSVDSLDSVVYSQIRAGKKLSTCLRTIDDLLEYKNSRAKDDRSPLAGTFSITASMTVQQANWDQAASFFDYWKSRNVRTYFGPLFSPKQLSLQQLPDSTKRAALEYFGDLLFRSGEESLYSILKLLASVPKNLKSMDRELANSIAHER